MIEEFTEGKLYICSPTSRIFVKLARVYQREIIGVNNDTLTDSRISRICISLNSVHIAFSIKLSRENCKSSLRVADRETIIFTFAKLPERFFSPPRCGFNRNSRMYRQCIALINRKPSLYAGRINIAIDSKLHRSSMLDTRANYPLR